MTRNYLSAFLIAFSFFTVKAQYSVTASVIDPDGAPEEYATYRIFTLPDTIRPITGNITGDDGLIQASLANPGDYKLQILAAMKLPVSVDFQVTDDAPDANLGIISTQFAGQTLNELTVTAQRPLVTKEIDRIGYDVTADAEASTSSLRDILRKVPLVAIDDDGNIKVNGSDDFKIYRNGRPNNAFTKNAKDIFAAIPASTIKKIEVITDPGAREDAESSGLILNIVTTSTVAMEGLTGSIGINYPINRGPQANAFIMTQLKKLTLSGSGGYYSYFKRNSTGDISTVINYDETGNILQSDSKFQAGGHGGWFNIEGSLEIDTLNLITTSLNGFIAKNSYDIQSTIAMADGLGIPEYTYNENSFFRKNGYTDIDFSLDYQRSTRLKGEAVTLSYRLSHTRQDQDQTTLYTFLLGNPFPYNTNLSDFDLKFFEHTFQLDWSRPLGQHYILDTGAKYILRNSHSINHQELIDYDKTFDEFEHRYNIFALYADARATYGRFTFRAGLRYEYSRLSADFITNPDNNFHSNLNDVVPNASIAWNASQSSMWKLSYNRNIQRPGISYLNPAVTVMPHMVTYGNPDLASTSLDNILINYSLIKRKFNLDLTATFMLANNGTGQKQWTDKDNITYSTYDNLMHRRKLALSAFFQWQITDKTSWMLNGDLHWDRFSVPGVSLARLNGYVYTRIQQKLPWELNLTIGANYFSGFCNTPYTYFTTAPSNIGYSLGIKRSFLKNKTLDISLTLQNIGVKNAHNTNYTLNNGTNSVQRFTQHHRQNLTIAINWRFGNLRAQVKKAATTITNDDLQGRKN